MTAALNDMFVEDIEETVPAPETRKLVYAYTDPGRRDQHGSLVVDAKIVAHTRRHHGVLYSRADKLFTRLRAARLDNTLEAEMRRLTTIDVLIVDDLCEASHNSSYVKQTRQAQPIFDSTRPMSMTRLK